MKKNTKEKIIKNKQENADKRVMLDKVLDGTIIKKEKNFIYLMSKSGKKKIKIFFVSETSFIEMKLSKSGKVISQTEIKYNNIKDGDSVSLVVGKNKEKDIVYIVRKIAVNL